MSDSQGGVCLVCAAPSGAPVYRYDGPTSISSTAKAIGVPTVVFSCTRCGHVQTPPLADITAYYDSDYNVRLESEEADDLYALVDGQPVYRTQHQASVAAIKLALPKGASVLDYGCGKGLSLRALLQERPDLVGAVFDVSDAYRPAWDTFVPRPNQAAYETPPSWAGRFDAVLSFFALEHAADPRGFLRDVAALLKPGGQLHLTVPNVRRNIGDFIVVDHVNHFMPSSIAYAFAQAGFTDLRIDEDAHEAAYVLNARRGTATTPRLDPAEVARYNAEARAYAAFWDSATERVAAFERQHGTGGRSAIYGSGFYGVFIASRLTDRGRLAYFLDRNPHQQEKTIFDRPVVAPEAIEDDVRTVYVGLNPERAKAIIASVKALGRVPREYGYL